MASVPAIGNKVTLPYHHRVQGRLQPGMSVYVQGVVPIDAYRFELNFACDNHEGADIPFQFSLLFDGKGKIEFNTLQDGRWHNKEEHRMPFPKGQSFNIIFTVSDEEYEIVVNGNPFYGYRHRISPRCVKFISADGDVDLLPLTVTGGSMTGGPMTGNLTLPYEYFVPDGLHPGMSVSVRGKLLKRTKRLIVDLSCGLYYYAEVPFGFRIDFASDAVMSFSSFQRGSSEDAEKHQRPFKKGQNIEVTFSVTHEEYEILVNGNYFNYQHRIAPKYVKVVTVAGDLEVHSVNVSGRGPTTGAVPAVIKPLVPYSGNIPGGLKPERTIIVAGSVPDDAVRFLISFLTSSDIALEINVDPKRREVLCKSYVNGRWDKDQLYAPDSFPCGCGQYFEFSILCGNYDFTVHANGHINLLRYAHRYRHFQEINTLRIEGDLTLFYIQY